MIQELFFLTIGPRIYVSVPHRQQSRKSPVDGGEVNGKMPWIIQIIPMRFNRELILQADPGIGAIIRVIGDEDPEASH